MSDIIASGLGIYITYNLTKLGLKLVWNTTKLTSRIAWNIAKGVVKGTHVGAYYGERLIRACAGQDPKTKCFINYPEYNAFDNEYDDDWDEKTTARDLDADEAINGPIDAYNFFMKYFNDDEKQVIICRILDQCGHSSSYYCPEDYEWVMNDFTPEQIGGTLIDELGNEPDDWLPIELVEIDDDTYDNQVIHIDE
jgi:hypothetical protein